MPTKVYFDFETRSKCDLKVHGLWRYAHDPSTEVVLLTWVYHDTDEVHIWDFTQPKKGVEQLQHLFKHIRGGIQLYAQNSQFDFKIWNEVFTRQMSAPPILLENLHDLMAQAQMCALPGNLDQMAKAMGVAEDKQKLADGKGLIRRFCEPDRDDPDRFHDPADFPDGWEKFREYGKQDAWLLKHLSEKLPKVEGFERKLWLLTQRMNIKGVPVDVYEIEQILKVATIEKERLDAECRELTTVPDDDGNPVVWVPDLNKVARLKRFLNEYEDMGTVGSLAADVLDKYLQQDDLTPRARRLLALRKIAAKSSIAKYQKILDTQCDGLLHGLFVYCGAGRTGRFSSRGGLNLQNLPRPPLKNKHDPFIYNEVLREGDHELAAMMFGEDLMDACVSAIRGVIRTPDGCEYVDSDFSGVENRIGAWLAGDIEQLNKFRRDHYDEYREFATKMWPGITETDVTGDQRQIAKAGVLAGIFGQSGKGFQEYADQFGIELELEEAQRIMDRFRETHPQHVATWRAFKDAMFNAVDNPGQEFRANDKAAYIYKGRTLQLIMPSGRRLYYMDPAFKMTVPPWEREKVEKAKEAGETYTPRKIRSLTFMGQCSVTRKWRRMFLHGSKGYQHCVQATARDALAHAMIRLDEDGWDLRLTVHDQNTSLIEIGARTLEEYEAVMSVPPPWAKDVPLECEGWVGDRFRK